MNINRVAWLWLKIVLILIITSSSFLLRPSTVHAQDSSCTKRELYKGNNYYPWVPRENVGVVGFATWMNIVAYDQCSHGGLSVDVWTYDANVEYKGGDVRVNSVQYQTSSSNQWFWMYRSGSFSSFDYGDWTWWGFNSGGHLDLTSRTRITLVKVNTALYFGGDAYAGRTFSCSLVTRNCW